MTLKGATAVVTGASSGIGKAAAANLAAAGASVLVNYHAHEAEAESLVSDIRRNGGSAFAQQADVSTEAGVAKLFSKAADVFGRVDIVVANAGHKKDSGIADMTLEDWREVIDLNLNGQFLCCREAIRCFRSQARGTRPLRACGAIVLVTSVHDAIPWAGHANYAASKGGAMMLMKTLAQEVAGEGIRVNAVAPGAIRTPINREAWESDEALAQLLKLIPYGRIGEPEDVARAITWIASDDADYVTGTTLYIDGGMMLYPSFRANG